MGSDNREIYYLRPKGGRKLYLELCAKGLLMGTIDFSRRTQPISNTVWRE